MSEVFEPIRLQVPCEETLKSKDKLEYNDTEKMISGDNYNSNDLTLLNARAYAKLMCQKYNNSSPLDMRPRKEILRELLGTYNDSTIEPPFYCDYGPNIHLGEFVYMNHNCVILDCAKVTIGSMTFLAPGVQIYTAGHPVDPILRRTVEFAKPIKIGRDCWIGGNAIILPGVTIGDGVTIGAGSVVTKDIESYCVVVGNPAKVIKKLEKPVDE